MQRAAGAIEAKAASAFEDFGQMGEGSEVMAASGQMAGDVAEYRSFQNSLNAAITKATKEVGIDPAGVNVYWGSQPGKVAVVGRGMGSTVNPGADVIRQTIPDTATFHISPEAEAQYQRIRRIFGTVDYADVMSTKGFAENARWMKNGVLDEGRTVVNFGGRNGVANYDMELRTIDMAVRKGILRK
jgi:hypothetical protein